MYSIFCILMRRAAFAALLVLLADNSRAQWTATGAGPFNYDDSANWNAGSINDQITNNPGTEQTIILTADRAMPKGLLIRQPTDTADSHYPLVLKVQEAGSSADLPVTLTLGGPVVVDFGNTNDVTAVFGDKVSFDFSGAPALFEILTGNSSLTIGSIQNARELIVKGGGPAKGGGRLTLTHGDSNIAGPVTLQGANLYLVGSASLPDAKALSLSEWRSLFTIKNETPDSLDQFPDSAPISCSGRAEIRLYGGRANLSEETLGKVLLKENCLELWSSANEGDSAMLTVTEVVRESDAILIIGYDTPDAASRVKVIDDKNILDALQGGDGTEGSTISIVPWVRGHGGGNQYAAAGFLTYSHDEGFRELSKEQEYVSDLNAASKPEDNVRITAESVTLSESKTINSLYLDTGDKDFGDKGLRQGGLDLGGNTLTISSGAISLTSVGQISNGTLTTEKDLPLIITGPVFIDAQLTGTGGLIYFGGRFPELRLLGTENTLTGDYVVVYGSIRLGDGENVPDSVTVRLHKDAEFYVAGSESITGLAGTGRVRLVTGGRSLLMLGRCEGSANTLAVGEQGEIRPGDVSKDQRSAGDLFVWNPDDPEEYGSLNFEGGTLFIDIAEKANDTLVLNSENKCANVTGGKLRVDLLDGYKPRVGAKWKIIRGTVPATGAGFERVEDGTGKGYKYSAKRVGNDWVLELVSAPR
jgi:hypothetical protein